MEIRDSEMTCTPKVRQKTFGVLLCLKSTGNMAMRKHSINYKF